MYFCKIKNVKKYLSLLLLGLFVSTIVGPVTTIIHFYTFQEQIIEAHCVNKAKPELNCNGHCYLKKELQVSTVNIDTEQKEMSLSFNVFWANAFSSTKPIVISTCFYNKRQFIPYSNFYHFSRVEHLLDPPELLISYS
jgi:hypothetical protein